MPACPQAPQVRELLSQQRRPEGLPPDCPPQLAALVHDCWRQHPAMRPSAEEVLRRLDCMLLDLDGADAGGGAPPTLPSRVLTFPGVMSLQQCAACRHLSKAGCLVRLGGVSAARSRLGV
jgi:hypothetical protein